MKKLAVFGIIMVLLFASISVLAKTYSKPPNDPLFDGYERNAEYGYATSLSNNKVAPLDELFIYYSGPASFAPGAKYRAVPKGYQNIIKVGDSQIAGDSIDSVWYNYTVGDPGTIIGLVEDGVFWNDPEATYQFFINKGELKNFAPDYEKDVNGNPVKEKPIWDRNGDGRFNVGDYEPDLKKMTRTGTGAKEAAGKSTYTYKQGGYNGHPAFFEVVEDSKGRRINFFNDTNKNGILDPQDLIRTFSDKIDDDNNGYLDDICGWDFFDDDNDPEDASSVALALGHGMFEARQTAAEGNNAYEGIGVCPECSLIPVRQWDTFALDTAYHGVSCLYASQMGASVVLGAMGGLNNTGICRDLYKYIYNNLKVPEVMCASDLNSQNHNWPTYLNEPMHASGITPDAYVNGSMLKLPAAVTNLTQTFFRNSNNTQCGGKSQVVFEADTGSMATGMMTGSVALMSSYAREYKIPLHPDQYKQLLCLWAEDVLPENCKGIGTPDPTREGWDMHTGYGRADMARTFKALSEKRIPHVARFTSPLWYAYLNPEKDNLTIYGDIIPSNAKGGVKWTIEAGCGMEPDSYKPIASGSSTGENIMLADLNLNDVYKKVFGSVDVSNFPSTPENLPTWDPGIQPNRNSLTVRLRVTSTDKALDAEDRRIFMLCNDRSLLRGWPKFINAGGEYAPRFADLNGDNIQELIIATSDGRVLIYEPDGSPYMANGREISFKAEKWSIAVKHNINIEGAELLPALLTPVIGDIDKDNIKEIITCDNDYVYCFKADGTKQAGFPVKYGYNFWRDLDAGKINFKNSIGFGATGAPVIHDMDGDGKMEIIVGAQDQRVYAWHSDGSKVKGWPVYARLSDTVGNRIIHSPCIADINGDGIKEIIVSTNEARSKDTKNLLNEIAESAKNDLLVKGVVAGDLVDEALKIITRLAGKEVLVFAIKPEGSSNDDDGQTVDKSAFVSGWPVGCQVLLGDILPQICPSTKISAHDFDNDGKDEIIAGFMSGKTFIIRGNGKLYKELDQAPMGKNCVGIFDKSLAINGFANPVIGDINGDGKPEVAAGGLTFMFAVNLLLLGQNIPFNHAIQVWNPETGRFFDSFPRSIDDFVYSDVSLADVDGDGIPDIISGSGLNLLHAYGTNGLDKPGFPKMNGGWMMNTPVVADIDDDGKNEIAGITREGYIFIWKTNGIYSKYGDWPTYGHDNFSSSNTATDSIPPSNAADIQIVDSGVQFRCPGDDGWHGKANDLALYGSNEPITAYNIASATLISHYVPIEGGKQLLVKMDPSRYGYYAVVAVDKAGNSSQLPIPKGGTPVSPEESGDSGGSNSGWCFIGTALS